MRSEEKERGAAELQLLLPLVAPSRRPERLRTTVSPLTGGWKEGRKKGGGRPERRSHRGLFGSVKPPLTEGRRSPTIKKQHLGRCLLLFLPQKQQDEGALQERRRPESRSEAHRPDAAARPNNGQKRRQFRRSGWRRRRSSSAHGSSGRRRSWQLRFDVAGKNQARMFPQT